jgi:hypothetical protein
MNRSAFLILLPLLGACDMHSKTPAKGDENVVIQADEGGNVEFDLPVVGGKLKVPAGMMHSGDVDIDGVKLMPGSSVNGFSVFAGDKGATVNLGFRAPASPDEVRSYYVAEFKKKGVEAALNGDTITGKSKDGSNFTIQVAPAAEGSQGKIVIHDKD